MRNRSIPGAGNPVGKINRGSDSQCPAYAFAGCENIYAVITDAAVMAFSIPLCEGMKGIKHKLCSEEIIQ